jgi:hypothetical protein
VQPSKISDTGESLLRRVPLAADVALIELVNAIHVAGDVIAFRQRRDVVGALLDRLTGAHSEKAGLHGRMQLLATERLLDLVVQLLQGQQVSYVALARTQESVLEARRAIRGLQGERGEERLLLAESLRRLEALSSDVQAGIAALHARVDTLEHSHRAHLAVDTVVSDWTAGRSYAGLPPVVQVHFVAAQVFSGYPAAYELETNDRTTFRTLLATKMLTAFGYQPSALLSVARLFQSAWDDMTADDREIVAASFEPRRQPPPSSESWRFVLGTVGELGLMDEAVRPRELGAFAAELHRHVIGPLPRTVSMGDLVAGIVDEAAETSACALERRS